MKDKIIYFSVGMLLMYFLMTLLGFSRSSMDIMTSTQRDEIINSNSILTDTSITGLPALVKAENVMTDDIQNTESYGDENTLKKKSDHNATMRSFRLKKFTSKFAKTLNFDPIKLEQITHLADLKMAREQALDDMIFVDIDDPNVQAQQAIMSMPDHELTPRELNIKKASIDNYTEYTELVEQTRVAFEDELTNLLSAQELQAFRRQETDLMNGKFERYVNAIGESAQAHLSDLNDFQMGQVDKIIIGYSARNLGQTPIGSSISTNPVKVSDNAQQHISNLYDELALVLSAEQMAKFRAAPIMFDFVL